MPISASGQFIAFQSDAEDIGGLRFGVTNGNENVLDTNGDKDVFIYRGRVSSQSSPSSFSPCSSSSSLLTKPCNETLQDSNNVCKSACV